MIAAIVEEARARIQKRKGEPVEAIARRVREQLNAGWYGLEETSDDALTALLTDALLALKDTPDGGGT